MIILENGEIVNIDRLLFVQKESWSNGGTKRRLIYPGSSKLISDDDYKRILKHIVPLQ